jgi:hypothetical protein
MNNGDSFVGRDAVPGGRLGGGAPLLDAVTSTNIIIGVDFLSCRRTEVIDSAAPVESDAPSRSEFSDSLGQHRELAVVDW